MISRKIFTLPYLKNFGIDERLPNINFIKTWKKSKMANSQNDIDIYYAAGNTNTKRQENEIAAIWK